MLNVVSSFPRIFFDILFIELFPFPRKKYKRENLLSTKNYNKNLRIIERCKIDRVKKISSAFSTRSKDEKATWISLNTKFIYEQAKGNIYVKGKGREGTG